VLLKQKSLLGYLFRKAIAFVSMIIGKNQTPSSSSVEYIEGQVLFGLVKYHHHLIWVEKNIVRKSGWQEKIIDEDL
jgi:hypothetical protein